MDTGGGLEKTGLFLDGALGGLDVEVVVRRVGLAGADETEFERRDFPSSRGVA